MPSRLANVRKQIEREDKTNLSLAPASRNGMACLTFGPEVPLLAEVASIQSLTSCVVILRRHF